MFFAWVVTIVELVGGVALILGLLVPLFGIGMVIDMIVAITKVRAPRVGFAPGPQPGWEFEFLLAGAALALALAGAGRLSLDAILTSRRTKS